MWEWTRGAVAKEFAEYSEREGRLLLWKARGHAHADPAGDSTRFVTPNGANPDHGFALKFMLRCSNISYSEIFVFMIRNAAYKLLISNKILTPILKLFNRFLRSMSLNTGET